MCHPSLSARSRIQRSAKHEMVKVGFTPTAMGRIAPSTTYSPSKIWSESPALTHQKTKITLRSYEEKLYTAEPTVIRPFINPLGKLFSLVAILSY